MRGIGRVYICSPDLTVEADPCEMGGEHTPSPRSYLGWHEWAQQMSKTHRCQRCPACGLWAVWVPKRRKVAV